MRFGSPEDRWSSLPGHVLRGQRPKWLTVRRSLDCLGYTDTARDRRMMWDSLETRMREENAERLGLVSIDHQCLQSTLRRGWYFGRETFRDWLLKKADVILARHRRAGQNYHGPEIAEHGMAEARQIIDAGLV